MQETSPDPAAGKAEWRCWFRRRLRGIENSETASRALRTRLKPLLETPSALRIASFAALPGEPDLLPLVEAFPQHQWLFPRVREDDLLFLPVGRIDELKPSSFLIREPDAGPNPALTESIDLFLCPGLGFDRLGTRLGRGRGYYDRALSTSRHDAIRVGIAFAEQVVDRLPSEFHDHPMTHLATPDALIGF